MIKMKLEMKLKKFKPLVGLTMKKVHKIMKMKIHIIQAQIHIILT